MSNFKGINRTLLNEFNEINTGQVPESEETSAQKPVKKRKKSVKAKDQGNIANLPPKRDYETRNRSKNNKSGMTGGNKSVLKPRQENSLGELTKKFIQLIKQTDDY